MRFVAVAVAVGAVGGLGWSVLSPRRPRHAGEMKLRWWPALVGGLVLQLPGGRLDTAVGSALILAAYALLLAFALANLNTAGMGLVGLGIVLNVTTIAVNSGMPVGVDAVVAAGIVSGDDLDTIRFDGKRHLEGDDDRLMVISDVIPVRWLGEVVSAGDIVMAVGLATVVANLLRRRPTRRPANPAAAPS